MFRKKKNHFKEKRTKLRKGTFKVTERTTNYCPLQKYHVKLPKGT